MRQVNGLLHLSTWLLLALKLVGVLHVSWWLVPAPSCAAILLTVAMIPVVVRARGNHPRRV